MVDESRYQYVELREGKIGIQLLDSNFKGFVFYPNDDIKFDNLQGVAEDPENNECRVSYSYEVVDKGVLQTQEDLEDPELNDLIGNIIIDLVQKMMVEFPEDIQLRTNRTTEAIDKIEIPSNITLY